MRVLFLNSFQNPDSVILSSRVNVNFSCDCIDNSFLGHTFPFNVPDRPKCKTDMYYTMAKTLYANLTNTDSLTRDNSYSANIPEGAIINVTVNCSCGNPKISDLYGLFVTYPLQANESLTPVAKEFNISTELLQKYNSGANVSDGSIVYVPTHGNVTSIDKSATNTSPIARLTVAKSVEFSHEELSKATDDFSLANKIGQGGYGAVYYAELRGEKASIKKMETKASHEFLAELKVLTNVHHLNLVGFPSFFLFHYILRIFLF
ncbi:hypothetical protein LUZ60_000378 [Juncus effusus]|nr:hypothetical protein LUZ60_000378 [Juncus effusus]